MRQHAASSMLQKPRALSALFNMPAVHAQGCAEIRFKAGYLRALASCASTLLIMTAWRAHGCVLLRVSVKQVNQGHLQAARSISLMPIVMFRAALRLDG